MPGSSFKVDLVTLLLVLASVSYPASSRQVPGHPNGLGSSPAGFRVLYRFENPKFYVSIIEVSVEADSNGLVRFKRTGSEDLIERPFTLSARTHRRLIELIDQLSFFTTDEQFQHKKDFSHMGWVSISVGDSSRERTVRFNYTTNPEMSELADILRALGTQAIDLFDIDLAQQHQPLDIPRLLEGLENDLRLGRIADPEQLMVLLREMVNEDTLPLIARNHAGRIIQAIQKGKYKSPVRTGKDD